MEANSFIFAPIFIFSGIQAIFVTILNNQWLALSWALQLANNYVVIYKHINTHPCTLKYILLDFILPTNYHSIFFHLQGNFLNNWSVICFQISHSHWRPFKLGFCSLLYSHDIDFFVEPKADFQVVEDNGQLCPWAAFQVVDHCFLISAFLHLYSGTFLVFFLTTIDPSVLFADFHFSP